MPVPMWHREATLKEDGMLCPIYGAGAAAAGTSGLAKVSEVTCLGRKCMAWRWAETHVHYPPDRPDLVPSGDTYGYCGLAGHPAPMFRVDR